MFKLKTQPENLFYSILLLKKPWRKPEDLLSGHKTYAEAFEAIKSDLPEAVSYYEKITGRQLALDQMKEVIEQKDEEFQNENRPADEIIEDIDCIPIEVDNVVNDLEGLREKQQDDKFDWKEAYSSMNVDQKRNFDDVFDKVKNNKQRCRKFITGVGGSGKSFVIKTLVYAIKDILKKDVAVLAPTGIAAFNVNGMTIHKLLQLPVEHNGTAKYYPLSDAALNKIRLILKDVDLIIIDKISMVSNINLLYIHLRLTEIFNTQNDPDGWFGKKHILLFGDLLQLPPVNEGPVYTMVKKSSLVKRVDCVGTADLWSLMDYDELTINMRQQGDDTYKNILERIWLGVVTNADTEILGKRLIHFKSQERHEKIEELCEYLVNLPNDTVCILPTCQMCDDLNQAMLNKIDGEEIELIADDNIDSKVSYLRKKVSKKLDSDEDVSNTAGLAKKIKIKIGAKVTIRRNIDTKLGLVNGTICIVDSVVRSLTGDIEKVNVKLSSGEIHPIEKVNVTFEPCVGVYVSRKQFPLLLSYAITVHKSQGLSLKNVIIDAGSHNFATGQVYVALSRVTSLEGLHLINYDPSKILVDKTAILEYNRLRKKYQPGMEMYDLPERQLRDPNYLEQEWSNRKGVCDKMTVEFMKVSNLATVKGLETDGFNSFANVVCQLLFQNKVLKMQISKLPSDHILKKTFVDYSSHSLKDLLAFRLYAGAEYVIDHKHHVVDFLNSILRNCDVLSNVTKFIAITITMCTGCKSQTHTEFQSNIFNLFIRNDSKFTYDLKDLLKMGNFKRKIKRQCTACKQFTVLEEMSELKITGKIIILRINQEEDCPDNIHWNCKIKSVPTFKFKIHNKQYNVTSAVFYDQNIPSEDYNIMIKDDNNKWIYAKDMVVENKPWPRNSKNAFLLILEQV